MTTTSRAFEPIDLLQLLSIALIWGVNNIAAKLALEELPPMLAVAARFALVLALVGWRLKPLPAGGGWLFLLMLTCVGPLHFGIQYVGLQLADDLAPMVVAMQLWAPASVMFAVLLLQERAGPQRIAGVLVAFLGTAALSFDPIVFAQWGALLLVAMAACCYGLGAVLVRKIGAAVDAWGMQAWIALATAPTMLAGSFVFESHAWGEALRASWFSWGCIAFGAVVSSIVANAFMFRLVQKYEVSRTTPYLLMTPVISFALAAFVLGDEISWRMVLGAALTMSGVALVAVAERRLRA